MTTIEMMRRRLAALQEGKRRERGRRIDRLVLSARKRGEDEDRIFWSIVHDLEAAPATTNRRQLEAIGCPVPDPLATRGMGPEELRTCLWSLIDALGLIRVFLTKTDHLDDRSLLTLLLTRILEESVPDLPLMTGVRDWIDCSDEPPSPHRGGCSVDGGDDSVSGRFAREPRLPRP